MALGHSFHKLLLNNFSVLSTVLHAGPTAGPQQIKSHSGADSNGAVLFLVCLFVFDHALKHVGILVPQPGIKSVSPAAEV